MNYEEYFFNFFLKKRIKLLLAIFCVLIELTSNYYAVKQQVSMQRFDMIGSSFIDIYTIGLSLLLNVSLVAFFLMKEKFLIYITTFSSIIINLWINLALHLQTAGGSSFKKLYKTLNDPMEFLSFMVSIILAVIPILILYKLMNLIINQRESELKLRGIV
jgi:hypothetical protein